MFLRNVGIYIQVSMALQPGKPTSTSSRVELVTAAGSTHIVLLSSTIVFCCQLMYLTSLLDTV
jgi:hypothetical protein